MNPKVIHAQRACEAAKARQVSWNRVRAEGREMTMEKLDLERAEAEKP
jgi:hypothetical protein